MRRSPRSRRPFRRARKFPRSRSRQVVKLAVEELEVRNLLDAGFGWITSIGPDLGVSETDGLTSAASVSVIGEGSPGATFQIRVDEAVAGTTTVAADGAWSFALPTSLDDGFHIVTVENLPGAMYGFSDTRTFTWDRTAPTVSLSAPEFVKGSATALQVGITSNDTYGLQQQLFIDVDLNNDGDFSDAGESGYATAAVTGDGNYTVNVSSLPEGMLAVRARLGDIAGNSGYSEVLPMQVDPYAGYVGSSHLLDLYYEHTGKPRPGQGDGEGSAPGDLGPTDGSGFDESGPGTQGGGTTDPGAGDPGFGGPSDSGPNGGESYTPDGGEGGSKGKSLEQLREEYPFLRWDGALRVGVNVRVTLAKHLDALRKQLEQDLGFQYQESAPDQNLILGYLPVDKILDLEKYEHFVAVTPMYQPFTRAGLVPGQGDAPIKADSFRVEQAADGTGIKVGILSDSVNQVGGGVAASQATGDLPAKGVQVLADFADPFATDEGRAMLEIVHDVAPGADLAFHTAFVSAQNFAQGIKALAAAGSQVISDDVRYLNSPMFNDGVIAQAVDDVTQQGVFYTSSAGNQADVGFLADWKGASGTIGSGSNTVTGTFFDFGGGDILQDINVPTGGFLFLSFQWDDAYLEGGSGAANFQVNTNIDVYLTNAAGSTINASWTDDNANTDEAFELVFSTSTGAQALAFHLKSGPPPTKIRWVSFGDDPQAQGQGAPTVFGQAAARGALATAAAPWYSPTTPEDFTSLGGDMEILFDRDGNRLASPDIRRKPDLTAPDGVNTTFFGSDIPQDSDSFPNFFGTSAAAPSLAAGAALVLSKANQDNVSVTRDELVQHLFETALDIAAPGFDDLTGYGLVQLVPIPKIPPPPPDAFESNDTSDRATNLGVLDGTFTAAGLTINRHANGLQDYDWFRFTAGKSGTVSVNLSNIKTVDRGDIHVRVFKLVGGAMIEIASSRQVGGVRSQSLSFEATAGEEYFVWVYGFNFALGVYDLEIKLED